MPYSRLPCAYPIVITNSEEARDLRRPEQCRTTLSDDIFRLDEAENWLHAKRKRQIEPGSFDIRDIYSTPPATKSASKSPMKTNTRRLYIPGEPLYT